VLDNAASWGGDLKKIALAGESAGGNLTVAQRSTRATTAYSADPCAGRLSANSSMPLPSRTDSANAKPLNTAMLN